MRLLRGFILPVTLLLVATRAGAQQDHSAAVRLADPVPAWPESGVIPPELKDKYVFVDSGRNEYVVAYPENLGTPAFEKDGPAPLRVSRYDLLRNVAPVISVAVSPSGATYKYAYTIGNAAPAKQSIDQFSIVLPEPGADAIKAPAGWYAVIQRNKSYKVKDPQWIKTGAAAVWSFQKREEVIHPGSTKAGFEIEAALRPGFTVGYFRQAESVEAKVASSGNIPAAVKAQRDELLSLEHNSRTVLLLGPKFPVDADDKTIAADFAHGISLLPESEFTKATLAELHRVAAGGSSPNFNAAPRSEFEKEILNALKISLGRNGL